VITEETLKKEFYSGPEVANLLHVNNSRVRQICLAGRFNGAFKFGDTWLIPRASVAGYTRGKPGKKKGGGTDGHK